MEEKPLSLSAIAEAISQAGLGDKPGKPYPVVRIKGALTDLAERNLVEMEQGRGWRIPLYYGNYVAAFASRLPEHSPAQKALYPEGFFSKRHGYYNPFFRGNMPFIEGKIRALYYLDRLDELEKLHDEVERFRWIMPSLLFLTEPLDHERFERLSLPIRRAAVAAMFYEKLTEIGPLNELIHYLTEKPNPLLIDPTVGRAMGEALLLMGKLESARDYAELLRSGETSMRNPEALAEAAAIQAGADFFSGRIDEAIAGYEESLAIRRKASRKRKMAPRGLGCLFYQLALARRGAAGDFETASQMGKWGAELEDLEIGIYYSWANDLIGCLSGNPDESRRVIVAQHKSMCNEEAKTLTAIFFVMLARLSQAPEEILHDWLPVLESYARTTEKMGLLGLALEYLSLCDLITGGEPGKSGRVAAFLVTRPGLAAYVPFSTSLNPSRAGKRASSLLNSSRRSTAHRLRLVRPRRRQRPHARRSSGFSPPSTRMT